MQQNEDALATQCEGRRIMWSIPLLVGVSFAVSGLDDFTLASLLKRLGISALIVFAFSAVFCPAQAGQGGADTSSSGGPGCDGNGVGSCSDGGGGDGGGE